MLELAPRHTGALALRRVLCRGAALRGASSIVLVSDTVVDDDGSRGGGGAVYVACALPAAPRVLRVCRRTGAVLQVASVDPLATLEARATSPLVGDDLTSTRR